METNKVSLEAELKNVKQELEAYRSYHAEQTATELALIIFGFICGIWVGYAIGAT